jgi:hypothetical protein
VTCRVDSKEGIPGPVLVLQGFSKILPHQSKRED